MVSNQSRVIDTVAFGEETTVGTEASSYDVNDFGTIVTCSLKTTEDNQVLPGMVGGTTAHLPQKIVNLKASPVGSITFQPHGLQWTKYIISDYTEGVGTYSLPNRSADLPKGLSIKGAYNTTNGIKHLGSFLNNVRFSLTDGGIFSVTADIISMFSETFTGTVTYTEPAGTPLIFCDGVFTFGGNEWDLNQINCVYNAKFKQHFGIGSKTTNKKRFPTAIYRSGKAGISFDGIANIEDIANELEETWGGSNAQDRKSNETIVLTFTDFDSKTHTITMSGQTNESEIIQSNSDEGEKTLIFKGDCTDFSVAGTR